MNCFFPKRLFKYNCKETKVNEIFLYVVPLREKPKFATFNTGFVERMVR